MQIFGVENRKSASLAFGNRLETPENPDRCADPERPDRIPGNGQTERADSKLGGIAPRVRPAGRKAG